MSSYEYAGALYGSERAALRALATDIWLSESTRDTLRASIVAVWGSTEPTDDELERDLNDYAAAIGQRPTIRVDRGEWTPSVHAIIAALREVIETARAEDHEVAS